MENNQRNMKHQHNYFTFMIKKYDTEDFVKLIKPEEIQRSAKDRIIKEMAKGKIDYTLFGDKFLDPKFLENIIIALEDELTNTTIILQALQFYDYNFPGQINVIRNIDRHRMLFNIYSIIYGKLQLVKMTGDFGCLTEIQYILKDVSKFM